MKPVPLVGLILWRSGLLLIAGYLLYESGDYIYSLISVFGLGIPAVSFSLTLIGVLLVVSSLVLERFGKQNRERDLRE